MSVGPVIQRLTRRLSECPPDFLAEPRTKARPDGVVVAAVVSNLLEDLGAAGLPGDAESAAWTAGRAQDRNLLRLTLVACWLCHDSCFRDPQRHAPEVKQWLAGGLRALAEQVGADLFVTDPDRREELSRLLLQALDLCPEGESAAQASDWLQSLSSVERARVLRETRAQTEKARALREKMAAEQAQQAAARYSSE